MYPLKTDYLPILIIQYLHIIVSVENPPMTNYYIEIKIFYSNFYEHRVLIKPK